MDRIPANIGLAHLSALDLPPVKLLELAKRVGCASVALRLHSAAPGTPVYPIAPDSPELFVLKKGIAATGVAVSEVELVPLAAELDVTTLDPLLDVAADLGATGMIVTGDIADRNLLVDRFGTVCDMAQARGLKVHLEFMKWRHTATIHDAREVVEGAGRANGRVLIDLLHLFRSGGTVEDVAALSEGLVDLVQVCDATAKLEGDIIAEARGGRLVPGDGALPLSESLAALPGAPDLALEVPARGTGPAAREDFLVRCVSRVRGLLD
ncbi:sugar phosphate isomerase/epimerase family protein [Ostreiculturibacter nitratireducens]|uniref:sugar phosphate isomerase/epimerase family protein n=1 Tax=Ostreiculturibacter nitratireducens TaxID=3075226 RepID=UPI0031B5D404